MFEFSLSQVIGIVVFALATWGAAQAVYRSFLGELILGLVRNDPQKAHRIYVLQWELHHKVVWDPRVAKGDPLTAKQILNPDQLGHRHRELMDTRRGTRKQRVLLYLLSCPFCQHCQGAIVVWFLPQWAVLILSVATLATVGLGWATSTVVTFEKPSAK